MVQGALSSPDTVRNKVATTAPNSYRERTTNGAHNSRSTSMGGGLGDFPALGLPPNFFKADFNYVNPLRSLHSTAPVDDAVASVAINPGPLHALISSLSNLFVVMNTDRRQS